MTAFLANIRAALLCLREQKQRAFLSALGIMVGSVAIVLLVSIAKGVKADVTSEVEDIGVNVLIVVPARIEDGMFNPNMGGQSFLKEQDAERIKSVPGVLRTAPWTFAGGGVRSEEQETYPILVATTHDWFRMHKVDLEEGRTFGPGEEKADVCVMGGVAKKELFGEASAIGKKVEINKGQYTIIGVTRDKKSEQSLMSMASMENLVYLPYHGLKSKLPDMQTDRIMVQASPSTEPKALVKSVDRVLGERLDRQQYSVLTQEDLLGLVFKLMNILTWLLTGLTSIALFVGGVGIMAIMLMSVNERTKEIGIRKAVGARRGDIFSQFLVESTVLGLMGGLAGLALSFAVCIWLRAYTPIKPLVTADVVALSFGISMGVGAVFGVIPAMNAAKKDPVVALRSE